MACGITGDYIDQMMIASEKKSKRDFQLVCPLLSDEQEEGEDQEEIKGGTQGG